MNNYPAEVLHCVQELKVPPREVLYCVQKVLVLQHEVLHCVYELKGSQREVLYCVQGRWVVVCFYTNNYPAGRQDAQTA